MNCTVVIATFNGSKYIREQLSSVLNQTRKPDWVRITDDCSEDGTADICREMLKASGVQFSVSVNEHRMGAAGNFYCAASQSDSDVVFFCDQDDIWDAEKIRRMMKAFEDEPDCSLVCSDADVWFPEQPVAQTMNSFIGFRTGLERGKEGLLDSGLLWDQLITRNLINGMNMAIRKDVAARLPEEPLLMLHDSWYVLQAAAMGKIYCINESLARYRQHSMNVSGADRRIKVSRIRDSRAKVFDSFRGSKERTGVIQALDHEFGMLNEHNRERLNAYMRYEEEREKAIRGHRIISYLQNERKNRSWHFSDSKSLMIRDLLVAL